MFKVAKMSEVLLEAESSFLSRHMVDEEVTLDHESVEDMACNVDLHIFNHDDV